MKVGLVIDILYVSSCGKYIALVRDSIFSEYIETNKPGRSVRWNDLFTDSWIKLDEWEIKDE